MIKYEGVSQIFQDIIKLTKLRTTIWETEEKNFSGFIRVSDEVLNSNMKILEEFRKKLPQELEKDLNNILGVISFSQNKLKEALNYFTHKINNDSDDSQFNILESLFLSRETVNSPMISDLCIKGDNEYKKKYYNILYDYIVTSNYKYLEFNNLFLEKYNQSVDQYVLELKENINKKGGTSYAEMKLIKFFATIFEENKRERDSYELYKIMFSNYPKIESLDYIKILMKMADINYFHFHEFNLSIEYLNQAIKIITNLKHICRKDKAKIKAQILSKRICIMIETYMNNKEIDRNVNKLKRLMNEFRDIENYKELELALKNNLMICYENLDDYSKVLTYLETCYKDLKDNDLQLLFKSSLLYLNFNMKNEEKIREIHEEIKKDFGKDISTRDKSNRYIKMLLLNESVISVENGTFFGNNTNYYREFVKICEEIKDNVNEIITNYNHLNSLDVYFLYNFACANYSIYPIICQEYLSQIFLILEKNYKKIGIFTALKIIITYIKTLINTNNLDDALKKVEEFELWFKDEIKTFTDKNAKSCTILSTLDRKNDFITFFNIKCDILVQLKQYDRAIQFYNNNEKFFRHLGLQKDIRCGIIVFNIGFCYLLLNNYEEAMKYLEQAKSEFDVSHSDKQKIEICDKFLNIVKNKIEIK